MDKMTALVRNAFGSDPNTRPLDVSDLARNALTFRQEFLRQFGDPRRDLNQECGYPYSGSLTPDMYYAMYEREPIANRAVRLMPCEAWKVTPSVVVGDGSKRKSPLEKAWDELPKSLRGGMSWFVGEAGSPIWEHLKRADILSRIGRFGVLLLGFDDGLPLDVPVGGVTANAWRESPLQVGDEYQLRNLPKLTKNEQKAIIRQVGQRDALQKSRESRMGTEAQYFDTFIFGEKLAIKPAKAGKRKLLFMRAYAETLVQVVRWESDPTSPRFNQPILYRITLNDPREQHSGVGLPMATVFVHWSRLIHIADNTEVSEVYATPTLRPILNPILDVQKVRAGSGEMFWRGAFPGLSFETNPQLGGDVPIDRKAMREEYTNYMNSLERAIVTSGMVVKTLSPATTDPTPYIAVFMEAVCICLGCPVRVFKGSERGELASAQDDQNWDDRVRERQNGYCTPRLVMPLVDRLIQVGVLPDEDYRIEWPDLESIGEAAKSAIAVQKVTAISTFVSGNCASVFPERALYTDLLGYDEDKATELLDERDKQQEDDLADHQDVADEHGFVPTPPPGFQAPPPPPMPPGLKPPGLKPAIPPVKPGVANLNPEGVNQYTKLVSKAARTATNGTPDGPWRAASAATKGKTGTELRDAHRKAAKLHLSAANTTVGEEHDKHMSAYTSHAKAAAAADDRATVSYNWKQPANCPECGADMDGKQCGKKCGFSWRGAANAGKCPRCKANIEGSLCPVCGMAVNAINISDQAAEASRVAAEERSSEAHAKAAKMHAAASVSCTDADDADWHDSMAAMHKKMCANADREYVRDNKGQFSHVEATVASKRAQKLSAPLGLGEHAKGPVKQTEQLLTKFTAGTDISSQHKDIATQHTKLAAVHRALAEVGDMDPEIQTQHLAAAKAHDMAASKHVVAAGHSDTLAKLAEHLKGQLKPEDIHAAAEDIGKKEFLALPKAVQVGAAMVKRAGAAIEGAASKISEKVRDSAREVAKDLGLPASHAAKIVGLATVADFAKAAVLATPLGPHAMSMMTGMEGVPNDIMTEVMKVAPVVTVGLLGAGLGLKAGKAVAKAYTRWVKHASTSLAGLSEGAVTNAGPATLRAMVQGYKDSDYSDDWLAHFAVAMDQTKDESKATEFANANYASA